MASQKKIKVTRVFLLNGDRIYLMLRNGKGVSHGTGIRRWIAPGGMVDPGETPEASAVRECKEELGITIDPKNLTQLLHKNDPTFDADMYFYVCKEWEGIIRNMEPEKFDGAVWVKLTDVKHLAGATKLKDIKKPLAEKGDHLGVFIDEAVEILQEQLKSNKKQKTIYARW